MIDQVVIQSMQRQIEAVAEITARQRRQKEQIRAIRKACLELRFGTMLRRRRKGRDVPLTKEQRTVLEKTTLQYTATLKDEAGVVIPSADLTTVTLTLYNEADAAIINSRNGTDILNTAIGTVHATSGLLTIAFVPADSPIVDTTIEAGRTEIHVALIQWTWSSGTKGGKREVLIEVRQLTKVT